MKILVSLFFSLNAAAATDACGGYAAAVAGGSPSQKLKKFIDYDWNYRIREAPEWATFLGRSEGNDRWTDLSPGAVKRRDKEEVCALKALRSVPRRSLKGHDAVNYDLLLNRAEIRAQGQKFGSDFLPINHLDGIQIDIVEVLAAMPTKSVKDVENMLARLDKFPEVVKQNEYWLREGKKRKITLSKFLAAKIPPQIETLLDPKIESGGIYQAFTALRGDYSDEEKSGLQKRAREIIAAKVYPALRGFNDFLVKEYIPVARETIALKDLPDGAEWYAFAARNSTTTKMTPEELHQLGLKEVERITGEMAKIRERVKFKGDDIAFNKFLLTDKRFIYPSADAMITAYRDIAKRVDPELLRLFKTLPRHPYGIRAMGEHRAKDAPTAYYKIGSPEARRAGYVELNTYDLPSRPTWSAEALFIHEGVPGHHLQIALAQEIREVPDFRRYSGYTAFQEGWGLYAESLGEELGLYQDPYSKYGQLSYEMWRAVRLVVDTGMHDKGWSRQRAIEFMTAKVPKTQIEIEVEIDRYLAWPAQALAYKVGQLKFRELRERAQKDLGAKFDVREYHDEALKNGALPLEVLEKNIDEWIARKKRAI